jgi:uncharacterized SAM-binding protein YcdF (DUF218 family)
MIQIVKPWLVPGSLEFLLLGVAIASGLLLARSQAVRGWGRGLVIVLAGGYLVLSLPLTADGLVALSAAGLSPVQPSDVGTARAVVVLDGGGHHYRDGDRAVDVPVPATVFRALEALRVYRLLPARSWAIVTAGGYGDSLQQQDEGRALYDELVRGGIPADRLVMDTTSRNTHEHAMFLAAWFREHQVARFVLVTSATHARRARLALKAVGLDPIVSPAPMRLDGVPAWPGPESGSLAISRQAIYDLFALVYYRARGWV